MKEKRVLHVFNQYLPQTENWAYNLIVNLPDTEVFIGAKHYLKHNFYHPAFTCYEHPFGEMDQQYRRWDKHRPVDFFKKAGFKAVQPFLGDMRGGLYHFAKEKEIDLVHAHFADVGWYFRGIPRKLDVPFVVSFYGWDYNLLPNRHPTYKKRFKQLFREADLFLCEGEYGAESLKKKGCPADKIKIQRLGVDINAIPFVKREKRENCLHLVQMASFTEKKGHIYSLMAFKKALNNCPNLRLTMVGSESEPGRKAQIIDFVQKNHLTEKVTFIEHIDYTRIYSFLSEFDVFIHPSCHASDEDCEGGAPIVLLDTQATGMPVISTFHCDIPEEVIHNLTGILTPEKDVSLLADSIIKFYKMDQKEFQSYCEESRRHVVKEFNIVVNAKKLQFIYNELLR